MVAEWNSGNRSEEIVWGLTANTDVICHNVRLLKPSLFTEISDQADWGNLYYAMKPVGKPAAWALSKLTVYDAGERYHIQDCVLC